MQVETLLSRRDVLVALANISRVTLQAEINSQLFTKPIAVTKRRCAWPSSEVAAILAAKVAGVSSDELRAIVRGLEAARPNSFSTINPNDNPKLVENRAKFYKEVSEGTKFAPRSKRRCLAAGEEQCPELT